MSKLRIALEIALFAAVVVADARGFIPLSQTVVLVPLIWLLLLVSRQPWSVIGFTWPDRPGRALAVGTVAGLAMELLAVHVTTPWLAAAFGVEPDYSSFRAMRGNLPVLLLFLALSWTLAAVGEELCFRGFLMKRLAQLFGEGRGAWIASLVVSSALFGWGHTEQGVSGWFQEGLSGFLLGVLFMLGGRTLAVPIVAHGVSNTLAFVLMYLGRYPGVGP